MYLSIKNLAQHQHYKDRNPPWIKLHRSALSDYGFRCLQDASKSHLMLLWLLASGLDNRIPYDLAFITEMIGATSAVDIEELVLQGFIEVSQDDGKSLAGRKQSATPEERRGEERKEEERKKKPSAGADSRKGGLDILPKADCDAQFERWGLRFGAMQYPTFRKKLLTSYQAGQPAYSVSDRIASIEAAYEWFIEQDDKDQSFFSFDKYLSQLGSRWIPFGRMPRNDAHGLTERGSWAGSKALREAARRPRLAS